MRTKVYVAIMLIPILGMLYFLLSLKRLKSLESSVADMITRLQ